MECLAAKLLTFLFDFLTAYVIEITHHETIEDALTLQAPTPHFTLIEFSLAFADQHLFRLIQTTWQRVLLLPCLFELAAGLQPAVLIDGFRR